MRSFLVVILGLTVALAVAPGCATVDEPPPPDLTGAQRAVEIRIESLDDIERSIEAELEQLSELRDSLSRTFETMGRTELSLPLLRLVAMNCLNTEYQGLNTPIAGLDGSPITCRPTHIDRLRDELDQASPTARDEALEFLFLIDRARLLRGSLRQRIKRLPATINEHRDFIADERAMLRQLESDLRRRRGRYTTRGWRETLAVLDEHRQHLQLLDERVDELAEIYPKWPAEIDHLIALIYFDLSELRAHEPR